MKHNGHYSREELTEASINLLEERGVNLGHIADLVMFLQKDYHKGLTIEECIETVKQVMRKREVCYAVLTGLELDKAVENGHISGPIANIIRSDYKLYGVDEIVPLSIVNLFGTIALTNFGHLDKLKPGIIATVDSDENQVNTFLDDLICGLAAAGAAVLAHKKAD